MFRAFIVDDDEVSVEVTYMMFPWKELNVSRIDRIYTPTGLVERILLERPHLVFIDIEMGGITGLEIIEKCKAAGCESLFIIISGHDNFGYAHTAVNLGAIYYLLKPLDMADVEAATKKIQKALQSILPTLPADPPKDLWGQILLYIEKNYANKIQAQDICRELFISSTTFYNAFKINANETFIEYLTRFRLEKAKHLLKTTSRTIPEIAESVGIKDHYYFNKIFKKYMGMTALNFRKEGRKNLYDEKYEN